MLARRYVLLLAGATSIVSGCGGDSDDGEKGEREDVAAVVERLQEATRNRDAGTICREIYARETVASLERKPGGCEGRVKRAFVADAEQVQAEVRHVTVNGERARARVVSSVPSGKRASDIFELTKEEDRWRIAVTK